MSAIDTLRNLQDLEIDSLQRILLIADGTLTEILEAAHLEPIRLVKLSQAHVAAGSEYADLNSSVGEKVMARQILLQGAQSGRNYVYAESVIAVERLSPQFQEELLNSTIPLGRLWLKHRLETFKELPVFNRRPANDLAAHFSCDKASSLLSRRYRVFSAEKPIMLISEYFPVENAK